MTTLGPPWVVSETGEKPPFSGAPSQSARLCFPATVDSLAQIDSQKCLAGWKVFTLKALLGAVGAAGPGPPRRRQVFTRSLSCRSEAALLRRLWGSREAGRKVDLFSRRRELTLRFPRSLGSRKRRKCLVLPGDGPASQDFIFWLELPRGSALSSACSSALPVPLSGCCYIYTCLLRGLTRLNQVQWGFLILPFLSLWVHK